MLLSIRCPCVLELLTWVGPTTSKLSCLFQEPRLAKNEATEMETLVEAEKRCNLELSERWTNAAKNREDAAGDQEKPDQYSEALAQRDR